MSDPQRILIVPGPMKLGTVIGELHSTTYILWERGLSRDDFIKVSGGMPQRAGAS